MPRHNLCTGSQRHYNFDACTFAWARHHVECRAYRRRTLFHDSQSVMIAKCSGIVTLLEPTPVICDLQAHDFVLVMQIETDGRRLRIPRGVAQGLLRNAHQMMLD